MKKMRLEFNEQQQHFHLAYLNQQQKTFGWVTIGEHHEYLLTLFISHMEMIFPDEKTIFQLSKEYNFFSRQMDEIFTNYPEYIL